MATPTVKKFQQAADKEIVHMLARFVIELNGMNEAIDILFEND